MTTQPTSSVCHLSPGLLLVGQVGLVGRGQEVEGAEPAGQTNVVLDAAIGRPAKRFEEREREIGHEVLEKKI